MTLIKCIIVLWIGLLSTSCNPAQQIPEAAKTTSVKAQVKTLTLETKVILLKKIQSNEIGMVEVLRIPTSNLFRVQITPEFLEKWWQYKLTIRRLDSQQSGSLAKALSEANIQQTDEGSDIRRGVLLYSSDDKTRVGSVYFDGSGRQGSLNGISVSFGADLFTVVRSILSEPRE